MKTFFVVLTVLFFSGVVSAEEVGYVTHIRAVVEMKCSGCHGADSPEYPEFKSGKKRFEALSKGPRMDSYSYLIYYIGWPDTGALMRRLDDGKNTEGGKPGNMYRYLGETESERQGHLALFKAWVGNWSLKRWPEATKEDIDDLKIQY